MAVLTVPLLHPQQSILAAVKRAKAALQAAQQRQTAVANRRRQDQAKLNISVGCKVYLSTANIKMKFKGSPKLLPRWIGPFTVLDQINPVAFRLELPECMKIHNVFHISLLKPVVPGSSLNPPPPPILVDGELEYEVEEITAHRFVGHKKLEFLVKWLGYGVEHNTWEPEANCSNSPEKVSDYWAKIQAHSGLRLSKPRKAKRQAHGTVPGVTVTTRSKRAKRQRR